MMKGRRILAVVLALVMIASLGAVSTVYAASPLTFDGAETVLFNQSFAGLKSAADAPDFTFTNGKGTGWEFYDFFTMSAGSNNTAFVTTKNSYDLRGAAGFELVVKMESTSGKAEIHMPGGYKFAYSNNSGGWAGTTGSNYIALLKDDALLTADEDGNTGYKYCYSYDYDTTYTIRYVNGVWTINAKTHTNENTGKAGVTFTYKDSSDVMSSFNGTFGIAANYTNKITLYNMKLTQIGDTATVNKWKYDKTFSSKDTIDGLVEEGYTFGAGFTVNDNGIKSVNNNRRVTFGPDGKDFSGNYYFETQVQRSQNTYHLEFNKSASGYYRVWYGVNDSDADKNKPWIKLQKYDASTETTHDLLVVDRESGLSSGHTRTYKVWVNNLEDGSVDLKVEIYNGSTLDATLAYTDTAEPLTSGKISVYWQYCGTNSYLKYLNAYSILEATAGTPTTVPQKVIDKTFKSTDTKSSVTAEGFSFANGGSTYTDDYGCTTTDMTYTNDTALKGSYTLHVEAYRTNNHINVYFGSDGTNYYQLRSHYKSSSVNHFRLYKMYNGTKYVLYTSSIGYDASGRTKRWTDIDINVTELDDGSLKIDISFVNNKGSKVISYTDTATDVATQILEVSDASSNTLTTLETPADTGAPLTNGTLINVAQGGTAYVREFKITKYVTEMQGGTSEVPEYSATFYGENGVIKEIASGNIYFEYPVARLGTYTAVATLHNGNEMTGLKVLSPLELYSGKIWLFNVADASDAKVRVYFFDAEDTLNRLTEVYELN